MIYKFRSPETGEIKEIYIAPSEEKSVYRYGGESDNRPKPVEYVDEEGVKWERIFTIPNASIDTRVDPYSEGSFKKNTDKKGTTIGQIWDTAAELKEKRGGDNDPISRKYEAELRKKRRGKPTAADLTKDRTITIKDIANKKISTS